MTEEWRIAKARKICAYWSRNRPRRNYLSQGGRNWFGDIAELNNELLNREIDAAEPEEVLRQANEALSRYQSR